MTKDVAPSCHLSIYLCSPVFSHFRFFFQRHISRFIDVTCATSLFLLYRPQINKAKRKRPISRVYSNNFITKTEQLLTVLFAAKLKINSFVISVTVNAQQRIRVLLILNFFRLADLIKLFLNSRNGGNNFFYPTKQEGLYYV